MTITAAFRRWIFVASAALVAIFGNAAFSDGPVRAYRRVLVPADNPASWPRGDTRLLPVEADDFERWVAAANEPASIARIADAEYSARFDGNRLVDARGWWRIERVGSRTAWLALDHASLAIENAKWRESNSKAVRVGWSLKKDSGTLARGLEVPIDGTLDFTWRTTRFQTSGISQAIHLGLPIATQTRLLLDLPAFCRPVVEASVILERPDSEAQGGVWTLALAPQTSQELRIEDTRHKSKLAPEVTLREDCHYSIQRTGIELRARLTLSSRDSLPKTIQVRLPGGFQVAMASCDDTQLDWHAERSSSDGEYVSIEVPQQTSSRKAEIVLEAWTQFSTNQKQQLSLPVVDGLFWSSGEIELEIDESLMLCELDAADCLQSDAYPRSSSPQTGRSLQFSAHSPAATVECEFQHRPPQGVVQSGVSLELGGAEVTGQVVSRIATGRGSLHRLAAELASGWIVDAVESRPADIVGEWYVDKSVEPHSLRLQLRRAIAPGESVELEVSATRPSAATNSFWTGDLMPLRWQMLRPEETLLRLRPADQFELAINGPWSELEENSLSNAQRTLLAPEKLARTAVVSDDDRAMVRLTPRKVAYDATIQVAANLAGKCCELGYKLVCSPQGGGIDHVLVFFAQPAAEPIEWQDAETGRRLDAHRVPESDPRLGGLPQGGQLWRLEFGRLYARPITISATQSLVWHERQPIPLVSLPDAASQQGRVTIAGSDSAPAILSRNLSPAPLPAERRTLARREGAAQIHAFYRFQPTRFYDSAATPELEIEPISREAKSLPLVTRLDLVSRYAVNGTGTHRAVLQVEYDTNGQFDLQFPPDFVVTDARLDRKPLQTQRASRISILLAGGANHRVEVELASRGPRLRNGCRLRPPLPQGRSAVLSGEWLVHLPAGYVAHNFTEELEFDSCVRLFGVLARRSGRPFNPLDPGEWNSLWAQATRLLAPPAQAAAMAGSSSNHSESKTGTEPYRFSLGTAAPVFVTVSHEETTTAEGIAVFIVCAVAAQIAQLRLRTKIWLGITAAATSLILPAAWAPWATSVTLGFVASSIWQWSQLGNRSRTVAIAITLLSAAFPAGAHGAPAKSKIESVFVPVDSDRARVGTKYFVSTDFLHELLTYSMAAGRQSDWMLTGMRCDGQLVQENGQVVIAKDDWRLTCDVDVATRDAVVDLPIERADANWKPVASVDGIPAPLIWNKKGHGCQIRVSEPGRARISFAFAPVIKSANSRTHVRLNLPPVFGTEISLQTPRELGELVGRSVAFTRQDKADLSTWLGELDASGILEIEWPNDPELQASQSKGQISQLQLLQIDRAGLTLELVLARRTKAEWPDTLMLNLEDDWQLDSDKSLGLNISAEESVDGEREVEVVVPPALRSAEQLRLTFTAKRASPWGRIRPPIIGVTSVERADRWLAVVCDSTIECQPSAAVTASIGLPAILATVLNQDSGRPPTIVVNADQLDDDWHLTVQPVKTRSTTHDRLSIAAGKDRFRINYRVDVVPQGADRFGWSIAVPPELRIENVSVVEGDNPVPIDWTWGSPERVNAFFDRPVDRAYRVELRGQMPLPNDQVIPVPKIGGVDGVRRNQVVALYREDDVAADWQFSSTPPWVESGASLTAPFDEGAQFVKAFTLDAATEGGVQIVVDRRPPRLSGATQTRVFCGKNGWEATWECALTVEQGAVDELKIRTTAEWVGQFEVTPAAAIRLSPPSTTQDDASLSLRLPRQARTGDKIRLAIRSPLATAEGQGVSAPHIRLTMNGRRDEFLVLPLSLDGEPIAWTRSGLEPAELPAAFAEDEVSADQASYRLVSDSVNVTLRPRAPRSELASIRLAETTALLNADGSLLEVTRYLVSPAGLDHCDIKIPAGRNLARTTVDGRPALVRAISPGRYEIQFRHPQLPQTLDVVTQSGASETKSTRRIELCQPVLEESGRALTSAFSLWTLRGDLASRVPQAQGAAMVSPAELASLRLDWWNSVSQRATGAILEAPAADGYRWLVVWTTGLRSAVQLAQSAGEYSLETAPATRVAQPESNSAESPNAQSMLWIEQLAELFDISAESLASEQVVAPAAIEPGRVALGGSGPVACFVSDGGSERLAIEFPSPTWLAPVARYWAIVPLAAIATATYWLTRTPQRINRSESRSELWGLMIGLGAWYWLRPSLVGLAIAGVSAVLLAKRLLRERKSPRHDSSKLPNSIPEELA